MDRSRGHLPGEVRTQNDALRVKVLTLGSAGAGKSCLIKAFCEGRFIPEYIPTIGIDYGVMAYSLPAAASAATPAEAPTDVPADLPNDAPEAKNNPKALKINIWDTSGDGAFAEIRNEFYRDTNGILLVFDLTNRESFAALPKWLNEYEQIVSRPAPGAPLGRPPAVCVVGTKLDLAPAGRQVAAEQAQAWAAQHGYLYHEASAATGDQVPALFQTFLTLVAKQAQT